MQNKINSDLAIRYIKQELNGAEKVEFESWLNESIINLTQFNEFKKYWELSGMAFSNYNPDTSKAWNIITKKTSKQRRIIYNILKIAASILIIISLSIAGKSLYEVSQNSEMETIVSRNSVISVKLPDNSTVWLNANSELKFPKKFRDKKRKVILKGEAFFKVYRDETKPFIVRTLNTEVKVLGTSFDVKENGDQINVYIKSGKVAFYEKSIIKKQVILTAGDQLTFNKFSKKIVKSSIINPNYNSWQTGIIQFNNTPLKEVCHQLEEIYHTRIEINDDNIDDYTLTGTFKNETLDTVLKVVEYTLNVELSVSD